MAVPAVIERWHRIALGAREKPGHDWGAELRAVLAEDCVFESPVVHTPQRGAGITGKYLEGALHVLNNEHFRYGGEWYGETSAVLEFFTEIDGITINGVDIISWNEQGLITHFKVMVRPLKAINTLHRKMGEYLVSIGAVPASAMKG